jgi:hypothetical protein
VRLGFETKMKLAQTTLSKLTEIVSLTPWLQPGVKRPHETTNRFNGLSRARKAVETAEEFSASAGHRAEATVLMRGAARN